MGRGSVLFVPVSNQTPEPVIDLDALLHPNEQSKFRKLCLPTSSVELTELAGVVEMHVVRVKEMGDHRTDIETAERIAAALTELLNGTSGFADDERALLRGAVEYFLMTDDADGDLEDVLGFDDDARVLNSVLDRLDRGDLKVVFD